MTENNNWPGKPGVPLNPERDGPHWLKGITEDACMWEDEGWYIPGYSHKLDAETVASRYSYLRPCPTPAEVEARLADALKWRNAINDYLTQEWHNPLKDDESPYAALKRILKCELMEMALDPIRIKAIQAEIAQARRAALEEAGSKMKHRGALWAEGVNHDAKVRADECQKIADFFAALAKGEGDD
jgi:hypothetical protein